MLLAVRRLRPSARVLASVARLCTSSKEGLKISERFRDVDILDADAWKTPIGKEHLGEPRSALEDPCQSGLRFPVGTPVRCFVGDNNWLGGTVVAQNYREAGWPEERPSAPYQVLLNDEHLQDSARANAIFAPADDDKVIQFNLRFPLGATAECRVGQDEWCTCTVMGYMYREHAWDEGRHAPYQVRVESVLPGSENAEALDQLTGELIWLPKDNPQNIRPVSAAREEQLRSLLGQRDAGLVVGEEYAAQRRSIIHAEE